MELVFRLACGLTQYLDFVINDVQGFPEKILRLKAFFNLVGVKSFESLQKRLHAR